MAQYRNDVLVSHTVMEKSLKACLQSSDRDTEANFYAVCFPRLYSRPEEAFRAVRGMDRHMGVPLHSHGCL